MPIDDSDSAREEAPDLQFLGEHVTFQPSGVEPGSARHRRRARKHVGQGGGSGKHGQGEAADDGVNLGRDDDALMKPLGRFRSDPLQFLREVSLYVSGEGWRGYDSIIGQPIYYHGFSDNMKASVLSAPLLHQRIAELAEAQVAKEEQQGWLRGESRGTARAQRRALWETRFQETAEVWTDRMICKFESKTFIRGAYYLVAQLLTRAYHQGIHVASEDVVMLRKTAERAAEAKQSIIFLPCHRSHVDYVALQLICYRLGIALPVVVAGDNLNFPLVGSFLQNAGAMYIRRSFGDDKLYATLVQVYIDAMLQNGFNLECFIEGGRSRTGKLLSPKFGILSFILDSLLSGRVKDAIIVPVSIQYDKVIETEGYVNELLGLPKKAENLADFLRGGTSVLSLRLGRVDVRFHDPWSLRGFIDSQTSGIPTSLSDPTAPDPANAQAVIRQKLLRVMGYKVLAHINHVSVVMPTALIGTVLLTLRGRGVGKPELIQRVTWLTKRIRAKGGRVAHFHGAPLEDIVDRGLDVLGRDLVGVVRGLAEPVYYAVDRFQLSFYRNMTIHLFIYEALVSAAMYTRIKFGGGPALQDIVYKDLSAQVLFLSTLFRGEFIFSGAGLDTNLVNTLQGLERDQVVRCDRDDAGLIVKVGLSDKERLTGREDYDFYCFLIWPFIEASWLAAVSLMGLTQPTDVPGDVWIEVSKAQEGAQLLGKTLYHEGHLSYFEAVNKETLRNCYQRFEEEGIVQVLKSKDPKTKSRLRLNPEWTPPRDPTTGQLVASGRLWEFTDKIASSRREGKNRRDGATVSTRVLALADVVGRKLYQDAVDAQARGGTPTQLTGEEKALLSKSTKDERKRRLAGPGRARL